MNDKKFSCLECGKMFALRRYVNVHKKRMHPFWKKDEEPTKPNDETIPPKPDLSESNPPPPKRKKPSNDLKKDWNKDEEITKGLEKDLAAVEKELEELQKKQSCAEEDEPEKRTDVEKQSQFDLNNDWKNWEEESHMSKLPLWGVKGKETFNIGAQYVEGLSSSKSFKDFAGAGTTHFKQFKVDLDLAKSWTWEWRNEGVLSTSERETKMKEIGSKMKENLCKAVANFRVALAGATDPENLIYKQETEEGEKDSELGIKKMVARNLLVCLSYLVARVVPSTRLALYVEFAQVLATAFSLGCSDKKWMEGVELKWMVMVNQLKEELPELVNGQPIQMSFAGEQVDRNCL